MKLTVVIPTLGGKTLLDTVNSLNSGSVRPDEILICLPETELNKVQDINSLHENIKILITMKRGQVYQRLKGFEAAKNGYVLQIDDDVLVSFRCCENLINTLNQNNNYAVGPKLYDINSKKYHSHLTPDSILKWNRFLIYWIINGALGFQPGKISLSGVNMGSLENYNDPISVEWLPGCCVMHRKENLILKNFYPYSGKAFAEDLIHSYYLQAVGIKLLQDHKAKVFVNFKSGNTNKLIDSLYLYAKYIKSMIYFNKINKKNNTRLLFFIFLDLLNRYIKNKKNV